MIIRWTDRIFGVLSAQLRRGALFLLAILMSVTLTLSPLASNPAHAQFDISSLLGAGGSLTEGLSSCAIETVGWVICPTVRSIARLADYGFNYINANFLKIDYSIASTDSGTYVAWTLMRNVASALFVVAFMVIVYSQLTGRGGGYNIKRLVPKLILTAVFVIISWWVCVGLVDITNIVGDSILKIFVDKDIGIAPKIGHLVMPIGGSAGVSGAFQDGTLTSIASSVLSKTGVAWVLLAPVAAVIVTIATICAAGLMLLIMRKVVVAMLILSSPILAVAYLLPNMERFFMQGVRLFLQLLLLYPIIAFLLGAGQIVSATIDTAGSNDANYRVSGDSYTAKNGGSGSAITDLTAAAAAVVPLLGVWFIFKNMSSLMSTAGARLSASVSGRRGGGKDSEKAKVTGNATAGAANNLANNRGGPSNRRTAFSRNRRRASAGNSVLGAEDGAGAGAGSGAGARQPAGAATQNALENSLLGQGADGKAQVEGLANAEITGGSAAAEGSEGLAASMTDAIAQGNAKAEENKKLTAKDLFSNINKSHESKDKDRKFGAGPGPAGGGGGGGSSAGTANQGPTTSYKAPQIAQGGNIVVGGAAAPSGGVTRIVAVPVQVDASAILGQQNSHRPPENITQAPISGTEEKAKSRAQKYLYDAQADLDSARDKMDILGHKDEPTEPPHVATPESKDKDDR